MESLPHDLARVAFDFLPFIVVLVCVVWGFLAFRRPDCFPPFSGRGFGSVVGLLGAPVVIAVGLFEWLAQVSGREFGDPVLFAALATAGAMTVAARHVWSWDRRLAMPGVGNALLFVFDLISFPLLFALPLLYFATSVLIQFCNGRREIVEFVLRLWGPLVGLIGLFLFLSLRNRSILATFGAHRLGPV